MSKWQVEKINYNGKEIVFPKKIIADVEDKDEKTLFSILESVVEEWKKDREILDIFKKYLCDEWYTHGQGMPMIKAFGLSSGYKHLTETDYDGNENPDYTKIKKWRDEK